MAPGLVNSMAYDKLKDLGPSSLSTLPSSGLVAAEAPGTFTYSRQEASVCPFFLHKQKENFSKGPQWISSRVPRARAASHDLT